MTRGLLRRGASPRIDRRAPRVRVQARARTYVHPLWHAESQLRGHRVRPPRPVSRSSAPRDVPNATTNACRSTTKQTRVASHTLPNDSRRDSRRGTRGRERSEPKRASRPIGATEIGRFVAATTTSGPSRSASVVARRSDARAQTLLGNHIKRKFATFLQRARDGRKCRLLVCSAKEFSSFSNRRAVNSGERLCASLIARTVTVDHHGGPHADAQRADDCTCGGSSRRAARFVAEPRGHAPRSNARRGASCQIFFVSVAAICAFRG
jgi:hypothetical protein